MRRLPILNTMPDLRRTEAGWQYTAPSGVSVTCCTEPMADRWMDDPRYHVIWSYASWATQILMMLSYEAEERGRHGLAKLLKHPRRALKARGWW